MIMKIPAVGMGKVSFLNSTCVIQMKKICRIRQYWAILCGS